MKILAFASVGLKPVQLLKGWETNWKALFLGVVMLNMLLLQGWWYIRDILKIFSAVLYKCKSSVRNVMVFFEYVVIYAELMPAACTSTGSVVLSTAVG